MSPLCVPVAHKSSFDLTSMYKLIITIRVETFSNQLLLITDCVVINTF